jgi:outer membrane protein TolC
MKKNAVLLILLFAFGLSAQPLYQAAEVGDPIAPSEPQITLDEVLQSAMGCNWELWISEAQKLQQMGAVCEARGSFDPNFTAQLERLWREDSQALERGKRGGDGRRTDWALGVSKTFTVGTQISGGVTHFKEVDPLELRTRRNNYTWQVTLRQPILRNYNCGELHTTLLAEQHRYIATSWQFVHDTASILFGITQAYWVLYFRQEVVRIRREGIAELEELERATDRLVEMDRVANSQLFQQRAEIANERRSLCDAQQLEWENWLQLQVLMGIDPSCSCETTVPKIVDRPYALKLIERDCEESIWVGLTHRSDLKAETARIVASESELAGRENSLKPELDFIARVEQTNHEIGKSAASFFSSFRSEAPQQNYIVGLSFSVPLWNQRARGRAQQQCNIVRQQRGATEQLSAQVAADIRSAVQEVYNRECQLQAAQDAVEWFRKAKEAEYRRWQEGYSTLFVVIDFIRREINAKVALAIAESSYGNAYINYLFQTGTWVTSDPSFQTLDVTLISKNCQQP